LWSGSFEHGKQERTLQAERLFLERCDQIARRTQSPQEIDLLDLPAALRQLLLDGPPLVHKVNRTHRLKLRFRVGNFTMQPDKFTVVLALEDGLDPDTGRPGRPVSEVDLDGFLAHKVIILRQASHSVADVIRFAANVAGGVHHDQKPKEAQKILADYGAMFGLGGLPAGIRQLQAIGRVTLKGLSPLIETVRNSQSAF
jgi:hypothetical protein